MPKFTSTGVQTLYGQPREAVNSTNTESDEPELTQDTPLVELVLNISEGCNLTCSYCFAAQGKYGNTKSVWMASGLARDVTRKWLSLFPSIKAIKLFGGGPFMNLDVMESVVAEIENVRRQRRSMTVGCVTNMTISSPRVVTMCEKGLEIAISIDGPQDVHDMNRRFVNGKGSYKRIVQTLEKYRGFGVEATNVNAVYTPQHMARGITLLSMKNHLESEFGLYANLNVTYPPGSDISEEHFAESIQHQSLELGYYAGTPEQRHSPLSRELLTWITSPKRRFGWCALGESTQTIMADGTVLPCYTVAGDKSRWSMGNAVDSKAIRLPDAMRVELDQANPRTIESCADCSIREICKGCPGGMLATDGVFRSDSPTECAFRIGMIEGYLGARSNE